MKKILVTLAIMAFASNVKAGIYMKSKDGKKVTEQFYGHGMSRTISQSTDMVIDHKRLISYDLDHKTKTVIVTNLKDSLKAAQGLLGNLKKKDTGKTKTVNKIKCHIYEMKIAFTSMTLCSTHYKKLGISSKAYKEMSELLKETMPQIAATGWIEDQITIETVSTDPFSGTRNQNQLIEIKEMKIRKSKFDLPKTYKKKTRNAPAVKASAEDMKKMMNAMEQMMKNLTPEQQKQLNKMQQEKKK